MTWKRKKHNLLKTYAINQSKKKTVVNVNINGMLIHIQCVTQEYYLMCSNYISNLSSQSFFILCTIKLILTVEIYLGYPLHPSKGGTERDQSQTNCVSVEYFNHWATIVPLLQVKNICSIVEIPLPHLTRKLMLREAPEHTHNLTSATQLV